jgi:hypothetical protein
MKRKNESSAFQKEKAVAFDTESFTKTQKDPT